MSMSSNGDNETLVLRSPCGAEALSYTWPLPVMDGRHGSLDLIETIRLVCEDYPELTLPLENTILVNVHHEEYKSMKTVCDKYNKAVENIKNLWKGTARPDQLRTRPSTPLLKHIINQCYARAVTDPEKLNVYEPFSPEVYGETSFELVQQMIESIDFEEEHTFVDLGSGFEMARKELLLLMPVDVEAPLVALLNLGLCLSA
ncbi:histone-lysine N-methyltransferase, H3 lysine-79 specific-like [Watersipora subatra]|uniref:histone-lysine N-methyltransferase, H3 lysine-79 specific-like n=1 Tax=Watersipora subatra TaxID=2589382 RepID=UPI00355BB719